MSMHVVWTQSGREEYVRELISNSISKNNPELVQGIFVPRRAKLFRSSNGVIKEDKPLFPGYLFIETADPDAFREEFRNLYFDTFIQMLGKNMDTLREVSDQEKQQIYRLCGEEHYMGISKAVREGTKVRFVSGPMLGMEAYVRKVEPRKCYAVLEMELFGQKRRIAAAFETFAEDGETVIFGRGER